MILPRSSYSMRVSFSLFLSALTDIIVQELLIFYGFLYSEDTKR